MAVPVVERHHVLLKSPATEEQLFAVVARSHLVSLIDAVTRAWLTKLMASAEPVAIAEEAVKGADLICTTTSARDPILRGEWLAPGTHINAAGACFPNTRELDSEAMRRGRLYTDCRESCMNEAGEFLIAKAEGALDDAHLVGELGEVLLGRAPGRRSPQDITIYESLGVCVEDLAAADFLLRRAAETNTGTVVDWSGVGAHV